VYDLLSFETQLAKVTMDVAQQWALLVEQHF
jgi:hypothetical protein